MPAHEPEALRKKAKEHAAWSSEHRELESEPAPAVAERAADPGLRPSSKEAAQVMSHWAEPDHTPDGASPKPRGDQAAAPAAEVDAQGGAGDLVLCQLPADAAEADVTPLRGQVKAKITAGAWTSIRRRSTWERSRLERASRRPCSSSGARTGAARRRRMRSRPRWRRLMRAPR